MTKILYISTFQFSGSTLLSFLLNTHSQLTSVGHTTGWDFGPEEDFRCSCGAPLDECPFFRAIADAYADSGLEFDIRNFGTAYNLAKNDRLNRFLTSSLPRSQSSRLELLRDRLVRLSPMSRSLERCDRANVVFVKTALEYNDARVFVDNSQDPYRFRHLSRVPELEVRHLHLIRDPRGAALSCRRNSALDIELALRLWIRKHSDIYRIASEGDEVLTVHYEDLCGETDATLERIHEFAGVPFEKFDGNFKKREHHILGNEMRLKAGEIRIDTRWQREMTQAELSSLTAIADDYMRRHPGTETADLLQHYFHD